MSFGRWPPLACIIDFYCVLRSCPLHICWYLSIRVAIFAGILSTTISAGTVTTCLLVLRLDYSTKVRLLCQGCTARLRLNCSTKVLDQGWIAWSKCSTKVGLLSQCWIARSRLDCSTNVELLGHGARPKCLAKVLSQTIWLKYSAKACLHFGYCSSWFVKVG